MFWIGGLTFNSVLDVRITGGTEAGIGGFNDVEVMLYEHLAGEELEPEDRMVLTPAVSTMANLDDAYSGLDCGYYYLEVTGEVDAYTLTWAFSTSK